MSMNRNKYLPTESIRLTEVKRIEGLRMTLSSLAAPYSSMYRLNPGHRVAKVSHMITASSSRDHIVVTDRCLATATKRWQHTLHLWWQCRGHDVECLSLHWFVIYKKLQKSATVEKTFLLLYVYIGITLIIILIKVECNDCHCYWIWILQKSYLYFLYFYLSRDQRWMKFS